MAYTDNDYDNDDDANTTNDNTSAFISAADYESVADVADTANEAANDSALSASDDQDSGYTDADNDPDNPILSDDKAYCMDNADED